MFDFFDPPSRTEGSWSSTGSDRSTLRALSSMTQVVANASVSMAPLELDDPTGNDGNFLNETSRLESRAGEAVKTLERGWERAGSSA